MADNYAMIHTPIQLGTLHLPNRFVMGSMHTGLEEHPKGFERLAAFYRRRAEAGVGLIISGGIAPNSRAILFPGAAKLTCEKEVAKHQLVTKAVHEAGGKICLQILHAGRYGQTPDCVSASAIQAPISPFPPKVLTEPEIESEIQDFVHCAQLAAQAGYDGIELMGSEGYFINQFLAPATNHRTDQWGGNPGNRARLALEIVREIRRHTEEGFVLIFRISLLDLVNNGSTWQQVIALAKALEKEGVDAFNTGIGWHESKVPTIASMVPKAAFVETTAKLTAVVNVPVMATNRINDPETAEQILQNKKADLICMARPFLADPDFVLKSRSAQPNRINTCIGCNQACLDHAVKKQVTSCLVNPYACFETLKTITTAEIKKTIAVVGAGVSGMACAATLAQRGHEVHLFERSSLVGGQFNIASKVPGKSDYQDTVLYFENQLKIHGVRLFLNREADLETLTKFDEVVLATGTKPRIPDIPAIQHPKVLVYDQVLSGQQVPGSRVAIIGAGGVGFDVAKFLISDPSISSNTFQRYWGINSDSNTPGSLIPHDVNTPKRKVYLLQRSSAKFGQTLGKTTGWIHKTELIRAGVEMMSGVDYLWIDDIGITLAQDNKTITLPVDNILICAGQVSEREWHQPLVEKGCSLHLIGGAKQAAELDAKTAILQGTDLGLQL